jgi:hypothetical protein
MVGSCTFLGSQKVFKLSSPNIQHELDTQSMSPSDSWGGTYDRHLATSFVASHLEISWSSHMNNFRQYELSQIVQTWNL